MRLFWAVLVLNPLSMLHFLSLKVHGFSYYLELKMHIMLFIPFTIHKTLFHFEIGKVKYRSPSKVFTLAPSPAPLHPHPDAHPQQKVIIRF